MLSRVTARLAAAARPASALRAGGAFAVRPQAAATQLRFVSSSKQQQASTGSTGRDMPTQRSRATAPPVAGLEATFTIRVWH